MVLGDATQTVHDVRRQLVRAYEALRNPGAEVGEYRPGEHDPLVSFDGLADYEEIERYWTDAPFSFISINYHTEDDEHLYTVVEPGFSEFESTLYENLLTDVRDALIYSSSLEEGTSEEILREQISELLAQYGVTIDATTFYKLFYYLNRELRGYGRLQAIMNDPHVEDVSCDGYEMPIFVYHDQYTDIKTNIAFDPDELDDFVVHLSQQAGRQLSVGEPVKAITLPDGSRGELVYSDEVTPNGSAFTLRKYSEEPFTPIDLINFGTFSIDQMAYLWLAIENNKNLIFAGGTASGKTTSMNAISMFVPPRSKVVSIEDTREISLYHENWLASVTRESVSEGTEIGMYDLLRSALRHRPEYIIVGEIRGEEALTLFQAMNTGHTTYSTMHADSVQTVLNRLENEPINAPRSMIQALDILSIQRLVQFEGERVRRNDRISEIGEIDQRTGDFQYSDVYDWNSSDDTFRENRSDSEILEEIREDNGWSGRELREELRRRRQILSYLQENDVTEHNKFTAVVNRYYVSPEDVLERMTDATDPIDAQP